MRRYLFVCECVCVFACARPIYPPSPAALPLALALARSRSLCLPSSTHNITTLSRPLKFQTSHQSAPKLFPSGEPAKDPDKICRKLTLGVRVSDSDSHSRPRSYQFVRDVTLASYAVTTHGQTTHHLQKRRKETKQHFSNRETALRRDCHCTRREIREKENAMSLSLVSNHSTNPSLQREHNQ